VTLVHAGAIYGERSPRRLLEAIRRPGLAGRFRLVLAGAGSDDLRGEPDVDVREAMPWAEAVELQAESDIGVVLYSNDPTAQPG
jgi:hypothetical protein